MSSPDLKNFGKYDIREEIGRGAVGTVYLCSDPSEGRDVALKISHDKPGDSDEARTRRQNLFLNEATAAKLLDLIKAAPGGSTGTSVHSSSKVSMLSVTVSRAVVRSSSSTMATSMVDTPIA